MFFIVKNHDFFQRCLVLTSLPGIHKLTWCSQAHMVQLVLTSSPGAHKPT